MLHRHHPVINGSYAEEQHDAFAAEVVAVENDAKAEAAGAPLLREALIRAFLSGWHQGGQPYDTTSAREGTRLANDYAALAATEPSE